LALWIVCLGIGGSIVAEDGPIVAQRMRVSLLLHCSKRACYHDAGSGNNV